MIKLTVKVDGMACGMCETHINDAIRGAFSIKKVTSSHKKGETVILTEEPISHEALEKLIDSTGYRVEGITEEPYEKRGIFAKKK